jgi:hypothetical protein
VQCVCVSRGRWFQSSSWIQAAEEFQIKDLKLLNTQLISWKVSRKDAVWCCSEVSRFPGCFSRSLLEEEDSSSSSSRRCECECVCCSVYPIFALHIFTACVLYCTKEDALNTGFLSRGFRTFTQQQQQQTWIDQLMSFTAHSIPVYTKRSMQLIS